MMVAECFEKIRVNPGNYADGTKKFETLTYETKEDYQREVDYIEEVFTPLVEKCKTLGRAMRIGTNHGSLSARILSYYGDTPAGMVESAFEFARVCQKHDYHNFLFSMKASNPVVMVQAYRLLAARMYEEGWDYPMHLGVTEAGEGEDGRMKSAIGIGALLLDGLGDTIRVSLTEDPEFEIAPCTQLANLGMDACRDNLGVEPFAERHRNYAVFNRRSGTLAEKKETDNFDYGQVCHRDGSVFSYVNLDDFKTEQTSVSTFAALGCKLAVGMPFKDIATSDSIILDRTPGPDDKDAALALKRLQEVGVGVLAPLAALQQNPRADAVAMVTPTEAVSTTSWPEGTSRLAVMVNGKTTEAEIAALKGLDNVVCIIMDGAADGSSPSRLHANRRAMDYVMEAGLEMPVIYSAKFEAGATKDEIILTTGASVGGLLVDGRGDGVALQVVGGDLEEIRNTSFGLLQGCRMRNTKTEYVSCPSCGRTLFDLQEVTGQIRDKTGHLPGVAIAVMGCIVNGPGEMADADFGYVGGAPGKIDLYVGKEKVKVGIPMADGPEALIQLIKDNDRWVEPENAEEPVAA
jgi:(E)-4-hydroxy-3-methylbut-2-enyl-diphosphate synthase